MTPAQCPAAIRLQIQRIEQVERPSISAPAGVQDGHNIATMQSPLNSVHRAGLPTDTGVLLLQRCWANQTQHAHVDQEWR